MHLPTPKICVTFIDGNANFRGALSTASLRFLEGLLVAWSACRRLLCIYRLCVTSPGGAFGRCFCLYGLLPYFRRITPVFRLTAALQKMTARDFLCYNSLDAPEK